jgi:hypothetical protein
MQHSFGNQALKQIMDFEDAQLDYLVHFDQ